MNHFSFRPLSLTSALAFAFFGVACTDCDNPDNHGKCKDSVLWTGSDGGASDSDGSDGPGEDGSGARVQGGGGNTGGGGRSSTGGKGPTGVGPVPSGGTDPRGGGGGRPTGGAGSDVEPVVYSWGLPKFTDDAFDPGDEWFVDNAVGAYEGDSAVHPPALGPGAHKSMTFDCGGREHTQLSFVVRRLTGNTTLELFDGEVSRGFVDVGGNWVSQVIDVPRGLHTYRFVAGNTNTSEIAVPYVLDSFSCKDVSPVRTTTDEYVDFVNFDEAFVPDQVGGAWFVDNMSGAHEGEAGVHPPPLRPGQSEELTFDCAGTDTTQFSFVVRRLTGDTSLELLDGESSRGFIDVGGNWVRHVIDVAAGAHTFRLLAKNTGTSNIAVPYVLDTFACKNVTPATTSTDAFVDFVDLDQGFVPDQIRGEWSVDSMVGAYEGEAAVHPPALPPGGDASLTFDCAGNEITQVSFVVRRLSGSTTLELFDEEQSRGLIDVGGNWVQQVVNVPAGAHTFKLTARNTGTTEIGVPYVLDTFACKSVAPRAVETTDFIDFVDFDQGFVPAQVSGQWFVDNLRGAYQGEAALHPPPLAAGQEALVTFDCDGREHSKLNLVVRRLSGNTELEVFDGDTSRGLVDVGGNWTAKEFDVATDRHEYTLVARNMGDADIDIPYAVDTLSCE